MEASTNIPGAAPGLPPVPRPTGAQAAFKDQLMGHGKGQMNLAALRNRAEELRRSIDRIIHTLQVAADRVQWSDALEQFTVINVQYQYLMDQLRPLLKHWIVHPKSVNASNAQVLPIMLATKLLPEMEAGEAALVEQQQVGSRDLQAAIDVTEAFNTVLDRLTQHTQHSSGPLDPKGPRRKELSQAVAKAAAAAVPPASAVAGAAAGTMSGGGPLRPGPSGARAQPQGAELLLAAASYGAGL